MHRSTFATSTAGVGRSARCTRDRVSSRALALARCSCGFRGRLTRVSFLGFQDYRFWTPTPHQPLKLPPLSSISPPLAFPGINSPHFPLQPHMETSDQYLRPPQNAQNAQIYPSPALVDLWAPPVIYYPPPAYPPASSTNQQLQNLADYSFEPRTADPFFVYQQHPRHTHIVHPRREPGPSGSAGDGQHHFATHAPLQPTGPVELNSAQPAGQSFAPTDFFQRSSALPHAPAPVYRFPTRAPDHHFASADPSDHVRYVAHTTDFFARIRPFAHMFTLPTSSTASPEPEWSQEGARGDVGDVQIVPVCYENEMGVEACTYGQRERDLVDGWPSPPAHQPGNDVVLPSFVSLPSLQLKNDTPRVVQPVSSSPTAYSSPLPSTPANRDRQSTSPERAYYHDATPPPSVYLSPTYTTSSIRDEPVSPSSRRPRPSPRAFSLDALTSSRPGSKGGIHKRKAAKSLPVSPSSSTSRQNTPPSPPPVLAGTFRTAEADQPLLVKWDGVAYGRGAADSVVEQLIVLESREYKRVWEPRGGRKGSVEVFPW